MDKAETSTIDSIPGPDPYARRVYRRGYTRDAQSSFTFSLHLQPVPFYAVGPGWTIIFISKDNMKDYYDS